MAKFGEQRSTNHNNNNNFFYLCHRTIYLRFIEEKSNTDLHRQRQSRIAIELVELDYLFPKPKCKKFTFSKYLKLLQIYQLTEWRDHTQT